MTEHELFELVTAAKRGFGVKCSKYAGSVCAELIKHALGRHGIDTSARDVFIDGVPIEIDLLVPKPDTIAKHNLVYRAEDVIIAFEIKNSGSFGDKTIDNTKRNFEVIRQKNPQIVCVYVALVEGRRYRYAVTTGNIGSPAYTLFWHNGSTVNRQHESTGDWDRMIADLRTITEAATNLGSATPLAVPMSAPTRE